MDSTKNITKKLTRESRATSAWATNAGNEHGQVIVSVLTAGEGYGFDRMIQAPVCRYQDAGVPPQEGLCVDRDCCETNATHTMFSA